jgi:hypothetical protein
VRVDSARAALIAAATRAASASVSPGGKPVSSSVEDGSRAAGVKVVVMPACTGASRRASAKDPARHRPKPDKDSSDVIKD